MWSIRTLLVLATHLMCLARALPVEFQWQDCTSGSQFYVCKLNNFNGCCTIDPCALQSGCPDKPAYPIVPETATCRQGTKAFQQFNPSLRTIDSSTSDPSRFHVANDTTKSLNIQQVFTFSKIPSNATNIGLFWYISETVPEFTTSGSATGAVVLLDAAKLDFSASILTSSAVTAAVDTTSIPGGAVGGAGFGFWADPEFKKPHNHIVRASGLPTMETLSFSIAIKDQGEVVIRQTSQDGFYLQYDC